MQHLGTETIDRALAAYGTAEEMIVALEPAEPVYCLYRKVAHDAARAFIEGFPGDTLYAVKANPSIHLLDTLYAAGIRHFDTASLPEIKKISERYKDARCYFMAPVRFRGASSEAFRVHGVKDFVIDSDEELERILAETDTRDLTIYVRLKTDVGGAVLELSSKFGAHDLDAVRLLKRVAELGLRPALAFHVGSLCLDADAFHRALEICRNVLALAGTRIHALDVGGGFPAPYPGTSAPPLSVYFERIRQGAEQLSLGKETRLLCEPGRGLAATGMSLVTNVIGRRGDRLWINDGIYGNFSEMCIPNSRVFFPPRTYRAEGGRVSRIEGETRPFTTYGPTCDSLDVLPHPIDLPADIKTGDYIEFGLIGAYSLSNRTDFNGFFPHRMVDLTGDGTMPPGLEDLD